LRTLLLLNVFAPEEIGARIAQARTEAGMTQPDLAEVLGLGLRQVQNLEAGVSKPYKHLKEIAETTNRPFAWFLHGDEEEETLPPGLPERLASALDALAVFLPRIEKALDRLEARPAQEQAAPSVRTPGQDG
jgi:transcriptional regulator with XRE-family HTH domain